MRNLQFRSRCWRSRHISSGRARDRLRRRDALGARSHDERTPLLFLPAHIEFDRQLAELFVIAFQKIADQRDACGAHDERNGNDDLKLKVSWFHCSSILRILARG